MNGLKGAASHSFRFFSDIHSAFSGSLHRMLQGGSLEGLLN